MKPQKLPSGSWRVQKMVKGQKYSFTFDHKPTKLDIEEALESANLNDNHALTFQKACEQYVQLKSDVLSPASIREYSRMCGRLPKWFVTLKLEDIDQAKMQRLVNEMSKDLSAKTVKDRHAFCVAVITLFYPNTHFSTILKKKTDDEPYTPSDSDIKAMIDASVGTQYHIALQLACYGLRREEICALEVSDLEDDNAIFIHKTLVQDKDKKWIVRETTKNTITRYIYIDDELAAEIRELGSGKLYNGYPGAIRNFLTREQEKRHIEHFSLHKFRHYFATTLSENNVPEADILKLGGWKTDAVMKSVYRHSTIARDRERLKNTSMLVKNSISN